MGIEVSPEIEELVCQEIRSGHFQSVDHIILRGVQARRESTSPAGEPRRKSRAEAVAHIREMRKGNRLPAGVTIEALIREGRA